MPLSVGVTRLSDLPPITVSFTHLAWNLRPVPRTKSQSTAGFSLPAPGLAGAGAAPSSTASRAFRSVQAFFVASLEAAHARSASCSTAFAGGSSSLCTSACAAAV